MGRQAEIATPARFSAASWTSAPRSVTGAVAPVIGTATRFAGTPARAASTSAAAVRSLQVSGEVGQQSKSAKGSAARALAPPRTARSISSIGAKASLENVPVTTGLAP